jgi:hypothetical protein
LLQLLEDKTCCEDLIFPKKCVPKGHHLGCGMLNITAQSK